MMSRAQGGAGFLHSTKPAAWTGGLQVPKELEEDAAPMRRCEEKRKEWAKHCGCDSEAQGMEDKLKSNEVRGSLEEGMPQLKEESLESAGRSYKATTGAACAEFHPQVLSDFSKETRREAVTFLEKVEQCAQEV